MKNFFNKPWIGTTIVILIFWIVTNVFLSLAALFEKDTFGQGEFWNVFIYLSLFDLFLFSMVGVLAIAFIWLIKSFNK